MTMMSSSWRRSIGELYLNNRIDSSSNPICDAFSVTVPTSTIPSLYVSLHTTDPGLTGSGEVTTTAYVGYARASYSRDHLNPPAGGAWWTYSNATAESETVGYFFNASAIQWPTCSGGTSPVCKYWGLWTAQSGGNFICGGPMIATGASFRVGYVTAGTFDRIYAESHGLTAGPPADVIYVYSPYKSLGGATSSGIGGIERTVSATATDYFDITVSLGSLGAVVFVEKASITVDSGKIPNVPAGSLALYLA